MLYLAETVSLGRVKGGNMSTSFTEYLMSYCMSVEMTTDDLLPEIYADWICEADPELIVELAEKWHKEQLKDFVNRMVDDVSEEMRRIVDGLKYDE